MDACSLRLISISAVTYVLTACIINDTWVWSCSTRFWGGLTPSVANNTGVIKLRHYASMCHYLCSTMKPPFRFHLWFLEYSSTNKPLLLAINDIQNAMLKRIVPPTYCAHFLTNGVLFNYCRHFGYLFSILAGFPPSALSSRVWWRVAPYANHPSIYVSSSNPHVWKYLYILVYAERYKWMCLIAYETVKKSRCIVTIFACEFMKSVGVDVNGKSRFHQSMHRQSLFFSVNRIVLGSSIG